MTKGRTASMNVVAALLLLGAIASAQVPDALAPAPAPLAWLGINLGLGLTEHQSSGITCKDGCPQYTNGLGSGFSAGAQADWWALPHSGLSLRLRYSTSSVALNATVTGPPTYDLQHNVVELVRKQTLSVSMQEIVSELTAWNQLERFRVSAGVAMGYVLNPRWESTSRIESPAGTVYTNGTTDTTFFPSQPMDNVNRLQLAGLASVSYELPLARHLMLVPELSAQYTFTPLRTVNNWHEVIVELGTSLKFGLPVADRAPANPEPPPALPAPELPVATPPAPIAVLATRMLNADGSRSPDTDIHVEVQFVTEALPLLSCVFFDAQSSTIPARYPLVASPTAFSVAALDPNPVTLHRNALNILGARMREQPRGTIVLRGYADPVTENADCNLAEARAQAVKRYLVTTWGIDSGRIGVRVAVKSCAPDIATVTKSEEGYSENRRVMVQSDDPTLLQSIGRRRFTEEALASPPVLEHDPDGTSTDRVTRWAIDVLQGKQRVYGDSGVGAPKRVDHRIDRQELREFVGNVPLEARLTLDGPGGTVGAFDTIAVRKDTLDTEVERLSLSLFGTSQDRIAPEDIPTVRAFMADADPEDSITISGYTDRLGDAQFNQGLSARRAHSVDSLLRAVVPASHRIASIGVAFSKLPPGVGSYDTPEERFLARSVQIEIRKRRK